MARVTFTENIQRHVACPPTDAPGRTVREVIDRAFADNPRAKGYVLEDNGALRKHMLIFVDGEQVKDRTALSDPVSPDAQIFIMQALSGG